MCKKSFDLFMYRKVLRMTQSAATECLLIAYEWSQCLSANFLFQSEGDHD